MSTWRSCSVGEKREDLYGDNRWTDVHDWFASIAKEKETDVLFVGDDHVALLEGAPIYHHLFAPLHCLCFGIIGDRCSHLLWRVDHGELDQLNPRVIVLSIGCSDMDLASETFIPLLQTIVKKIIEKQPKAKLFLMKLLPTGRKPNERRRMIEEINDQLERQFDSTHVTMIDIDPALIAANGEIDAHDMFDFVHLTHEGYRKVFEPVFVAVSAALNPDL